MNENDLKICVKFLSFILWILDNESHFQSKVLLNK